MKDWENETPIDDEMTVLDLLCHGRVYNVTREIDRRFKQDGPYVTIGYHHDFADSTYRRIRVTDRVVDALITQGLIDGKPQWGYTDMKLLRINDFGERHVWNERKRLGLDNSIRADYWIMGRG